MLIYPANIAINFRLKSGRRIYDSKSVETAIEYLHKNDRAKLAIVLEAAQQEYKDPSDTNDTDNYTQSMGRVIEQFFDVREIK